MKSNTSIGNFLPFSGGSFTKFTGNMEVMLKFRSVEIFGPFFRMIIGKKMEKFTTTKMFSRLNRREITKQKFEKKITPKRTFRVFCTFFLNNNKSLIFITLHNLRRKY